MGVLSPWKEICPTVLFVTAVASEVPANLLVKTFYLSVRLGVVP